MPWGVAGLQAKKEAESADAAIHKQVVEFTGVYTSTHTAHAEHEPAVGSAHQLISDQRE